MPADTTGRLVLVTGGAGYLGSVVVGRLLARGDRVRVLDSLLHGGVGSVLAPWGCERFDFRRGDVRDAGTRAEALDGVDAVVHLAAIVGDPACSRDPELARDVNLRATEAFLADATDAGVGRFLFASTCSNYGKFDAGDLATETTELRPVSVYAETKVAAEEAILRAATDTMATTCLRFATIYGVSPRMRFDLTVNEFARDMATKGELVVYGEQFWRPYIHVTDAARAVERVLEADAAIVSGSVFNAGDTNENYTKLHLVEILRERIPSAHVEFVEKAEDPRDYRVSFELIKERLGFRPRWSVPQGIDEVLSLVRSGLLDDPYAPVYVN